MFIFWGRKAVVRKLGHVADFCPICRDQRAFAVERVGSAGHVYYISFGDGELVGFQRTCQTCHTTLQAEPTVYTALSKQALPLDELKRRTYPNLDEVLRERMALEDTIKTAPHSLSMEDRHALIRQAFTLLSPKVEKRFSQTHIDKEVGLSIVAAIGLMILGPASLHALLPDDEEVVLFAFMALGLVLVVWQAMLSGRRFMARQIIPLLASTLSPLQPRQSEIQSVADELKQLRHKIGAKTNVGALMDALAGAKALTP